LKPQPKGMRAFVAIQLPPETRAALRSIQSELKQVLPRHSTAWTRPENLHLTLRFLGDVEASRLPDLQRRLRETLTAFGPVELTCERLGCFPDLRFPRVVWACVHDARERSVELHGRVNEAVAGFAERPPEARYVGHITLARPKQIQRADAEKLASFVNGTAACEFGKWTCREVELIRSELSNSGSRYTTLDVFSL